MTTPTPDKNYNISSQIPHQIPAVYRDNGPMFVEFTRLYYKWLETQGPLLQSRTFTDNTDISTTLDQYIVGFKEKYLKNIQFDTATNIKQLVTHSLDLYRAKGTERAIKLFFQLVFGTSADIYYPSQDIFMLSEGEYTKPTYLEITASPLSITLVGQQIVGLTSGATAFVERVVEKSMPTGFADVLMISAVNGTFVAGELLKTAKSTTIAKNMPYVRGSLSSLTVLDGGSGFYVGQTVDVVSNTGLGGKARVDSIQSLVGLANFALVDGGWGYSANGNVVVSNTVVHLQNVVHTVTGDYFSVKPDINSLTQAQANIQYNVATGLFNPGDAVFTYYANGSVQGTGTVMSATTANSSQGEIFVAINSGSLVANTIYKTGNVASANQTGYTDKTATGNLCGLSSNVYIEFVNGTGAIPLKGDVAYQMDSSNNIIVTGTVATVNSITGTSGEIKVTGASDIFMTDRRLYFTSNTFSSNISSMNFEVGLANVTGTWVNTTYNYVTDSQGGSISTVGQVMKGTGATFQYSPTLDYIEYITVNTDLIAPFANVALNAATYGGTMGSANLGTIMDAALHYANTAIGKIKYLTKINPGSNYNYPPFTVVRDENILHYNKKDYIFQINSPSGVFANGELIQQSATGARGIVKSANTTVVAVERLNFNDLWVSTTNATTQVLGVSSGFTANLTSWGTDDRSSPIGMNAVISDAVVGSNSAVKSLSLIDSGFNYVDGEIVQFNDEVTGTNLGLAEASALNQGISEGYSTSTSSLLSDRDFLYDGDYYQDFSYEIQSPISLDRYEEMLKNLLHVAGTKYFASVSKESQVSVGVDIVPSVRTIV